MRRRLVVIALACLWTGSSGWASNVGLTAKVGTLGPGADVSIGMGPFFDLRLGGNRFSMDYVDRANDYGDIKADFSWWTYGAYLDWLPAGTGFRITAGAMGNDNEVRLTANVAKPLTLYGVDYPIDDFHGKVGFSEFAPYLGIGYGNAAGEDGRWHFACDFGAMFQGAPSVEASAHTPAGELQPYLDSALEKKRSEMENDLSFFRIYPVIAVGVSFRF